MSASSTKKVVYIAGPVTGVLNARENFAACEKELKELGIIALNPERIIRENGLSKEPYTKIMKTCIGLLLSADFVFCLTAWEHSNGALAEVVLAASVGIPVFGEKPLFTPVPQRVWSNIHAPALLLPGEKN